MESVGTLYSYWRSSASYRVRIALALKGLPYDTSYVHLVKGGGEQHSAVYKSLNTQGLVPSWQCEEGVLTQSLAIIEYINECYPDAPLLPTEPFARAKARAMAQVMACETHPINNLRVLQYLRTSVGLDDQAVNSWYQHWVREGLDALALMVEDDGFCYGNTPSIADICLIPQMYNARRFHLDVTDYPKLCRIEANCLALDAFKQAVPEAQADAQQ
ncbi:maleylacetoacetate isomerase [Marinomonas algicola]|uniref:maleylacetoacetate isomerase n=1 Tax=Marinomonas algicola TaxID=2773454 RepID=UPI00174D630E|nr:maleylacetoacetate isomerase [Marinomonas algicola]